jgi:acetyl-CoA acetyltransferase
MHRRGLAAWAGGVYRDVQVLDGLDRDEQLRDKPFESWARARSIGSSEIAVSNVCGLSDGAGYVVVGHERNGLPVVARVVDWAFGFDDPRRTALASLDATRALLAKTGVRLADIDVFEIHDAFSLLGLKWLEATGADIDKVNLFGGSISLGHPIAATGIRLVQNAVLGLEKADGNLAMLSVPSMGGYGMAMLIERCH